MKDLCWTSPAILQSLEAEGTEACRLATCGRRGWLDRFGPVLLLSWADEETRALLESALAGCRDRAGFSPQAVYARRLVLRPGAADHPRLIQGDPAVPAVFRVREAGLTYGVDLTSGYTPGLFLDQRLNRSWVRSRRPGRGLNLFAFTGAFTVCAASVGAETISVDASSRALIRARENLEANGLTAAGHHFYHDDVLEVLPRLQRRGRDFDLIVVDPPTFGRGAGGRPFRLDRDFPGILVRCGELLAPGGALLAACNATDWPVSRLLEVVDESMHRAGRRGRVVEGGTPEEFRAGPAAASVRFLPPG